MPKNTQKDVHLQVILRGAKLSTAAQQNLASRVRRAVIEELLMTELKDDLRIKKTIRGQDGASIVQIDFISVMGPM